jgi:hypothetical protein
MYSPPETLCAICGQKKLKPWTTLSSGQLMYRYGRAVEDPVYSTWLFQFYRRHWPSGYAEPAKKPNESLVSLD